MGTHNRRWAVVLRAIFHGEPLGWERRLVISLYSLYFLARTQRAEAEYIGRECNCRQRAKIEFVHFFTKFLFVDPNIA